jgi:hypothetical protein
MPAGVVERPLSVGAREQGAIEDPISLASFGAIDWKSAGGIDD